MLNILVGCRLSFNRSLKLVSFIFYILPKVSMKYAFYFIRKALFLLRYSIFVFFPPSSSQFPDSKAEMKLKWSWRCEMVSINRALSFVVSDLRSETKGSRFESRLLPICRGELSVVITRLMSKCLKRVEAIVRS